MGELADITPAQAAVIGQRFVKWFSPPSSRTDRSARLRKSLQRLREGSGWGELLAAAALELQTLAGWELPFAAAEVAPEGGMLRVAVQYREESLVRACLAAARELLVTATHTEDYPMAATVRGLQQLAEEVCPGPSTWSIMQAAEARQIPFYRLNSRSLVQLGHGAKQRRILTAETDCTGVIGEYISQDKDLTKRLLQSAGVPVPEGRTVADASDAWAAACEIGLPVVLKPLNGNHGRGVFTDLTSREEIETVFPFALEEGDGVLVERCASGAEHRLLVVDGRLVAAMRGDPAFAVGDGRRTIVELVEELNRDPRRGEDDACPLAIVEFCRTTLSLLRMQGYGPESVPPSGSHVVLQRNGNLSVDVTDEVHPEVARYAGLAARVVGLDVAGIDIVADDIGRPLEPQGGVIVEVNASPGLFMHVKPSVGKPRPVGEAIVAHLFPAGENGRIPIIGVLGGPAMTPAAKLIGEVLSAAMGDVGVCSGGTASFQGRKLGARARGTAGKTREMLTNPFLQAGVFHVTPAEVATEGLGFPYCRVAVLGTCGAAASAAADPADETRIVGALLAGLEDAGAVVCRAGDPRVPGVDAFHPASMIVIAEDSDNPQLRAHLARGRTGVFYREGAIVVAEGDCERWVISHPALGRLLSAGGSDAAFSIQAAAAVAWFLHVDRDAALAVLEHRCAQVL